MAEVVGHVCVSFLVLHEQEHSNKKKKKQLH